MSTFVENLNFYLGAGTLLLQLGAIILLVAFFWSEMPYGKEIRVIAKKWGIQIAFLLTLFATAMTLYYSEILGFAPCSWCWFQRIFMYPLVVLFGIAWWKKDSRVADYAIGLSILGLIPSLYQHYLQTGGEQLLPCPASAAVGVECSARILFEFGYITFPLMAASLFAFVIVLMLFARSKE